MNSQLTTREKVHITDRLYSYKTYLGWWMWVLGIRVLCGKEAKETVTWNMYNKKYIDPWTVDPIKHLRTKMWREKIWRGKKEG